MSPRDRGWPVSSVLAARHLASSCTDSQPQVLPERPAYEYLTPIAQEIQRPPAKPQLGLVNPLNTKPTLPAKSRPRLLAWSLLPPETATLIRRCRQAQTSVHAAICAAFLLAMAQQSHPGDDTDTQKPDLQQPVTLKCLSAINLRRFLTPAIEEDFGCYLTINVTAHVMTPNLSLWDLAHDIKAQLNWKMSPDQIFAHLPEAQAFISTLPSPDLVKEVLQEQYEHDFNVTNLGRLSIPTQYEHLQLAAIYGPSATTHLPNDRVIGVATLADQMFFSLAYSESDFSLEQIEQLQQAAMQLLSGS